MGRRRRIEDSIGLLECVIHSYKLYIYLQPSSTLMCNKMIHVEDVTLPACPVSHMHVH